MVSKSTLLSLYSGLGLSCQTSCAGAVGMLLLSPCCIAGTGSSRGLVDLDTSACGCRGAGNPTKPSCSGQCAWLVSCCCCASRVWFVLVRLAARCLRTAPHCLLSSIASLSTSCGRTAMMRVQACGCMVGLTGALSLCCKVMICLGKW